MKIFSVKKELLRIIIELQNPKIIKKNFEKEFNVQNH
jgi:hypothetical protein